MFVLILQAKKWWWSNTICW